MDQVHNRKLIGLHNLYNIANILMTFELLKIENQKALEFIRDYSGLEHRIEKVAVIDGVEFINDSKSTSPDATRVALETVTSGKNIILIAGGENKGMSFELIFPHLIDSVKNIIFLPGDAGEVLEKQVKDAEIDIEIDWVSDMKQAVILAKQKSISGDMILLSPASSSLNTYKSFEDRGDHFKQAVLELKNS
jgi:UDP-N-acetylmuramoylalanine--D-glutamate ligase